MKEKILTVSIAAYNIERFIDTCLTPFADGIFNDRLEVLIVDDGSSDCTREKALKYVNAFPSIFKYVHKKNGGWGSTINCGITNATGKYFKQLDGDDFFTKDNLKEYLFFLERASEDIVFTNYAKFKDVNQKPFDATSFNDCFVPGKRYLFSDIVKPDIFPAQMHEITVKTSILKENYDNFKITENCYYTDVEYWMKTICYAHNFTYFDTIIYMYRVGLSGQSTSKEGIQKHYKEHLKVLKKCYFILNNSPLDSVKKEILCERLKAMAAHQIYYYLCLSVNKQHKQELCHFDKWLKQEGQIIIPSGWKRYELLNKSAFILYPIAALYVQKIMR